MGDVKLTKLALKNFIASTQGAIGSGQFRHLYVRNEAGEEIDVLENGKLSCAYAISSLLTLYGLIDRPHATVATTLEKMEESGWESSSVPRSGAVVYWPEYHGNEHIGIMVDEATCISNSSEARAPIRHGLVLSNGIKATKYYVHSALTDEK